MPRLGIPFYEPYRFYRMLKKEPATRELAVGYLLAAWKFHLIITLLLPLIGPVAVLLFVGKKIGDLSDWLEDLPFPWGGISNDYWTKRRTAIRTYRQARHSND